MPVAYVEDDVGIAVVELAVQIFIPGFYLELLEINKKNNKENLHYVYCAVCQLGYCKANVNCL